MAGTVRRVTANVSLIVMASLLTACAGSISQPRSASGGGYYKVGKPYQIVGKWYYPADDRNYRESGIASWYGPNFHGKLTANGERFNENDLTAAHRTLPMPSYVEVTNLENGRQLVVRVNDRGPFAHDRIIDLSRRSAQLLGIERAGTARVKVKRVYPGQEAVTAVETPAVAHGHFIQVAALSNAARAEQMARDLQYLGNAQVFPGNGLFRVRIGPYASAEAAASMLAQLQGRGYTDARIVGPSPAA